MHSTETWTLNSSTQHLQRSKKKPYPPVLQSQPEMPVSRMKEVIETCGIRSQDNLEITECQRVGKAPKGQRTVVSI